MLAIGSAAKAGQDPLMPCCRAYFVNSAVLRMPNFRITFALWNATVLREMARIAAISFTECPSAASCTTSRWRSVSSAGKNLHFGGSTVGVWVYTDSAGEAKMEIPVYMVLRPTGVG
jgi:hypothetical protein